MSVLNNKISKNNGSGLGVIFYGVTVLLILLFTAINIVNSKVIESGYNSLRDAVQTASSGSVIHLLTSQGSTTSAQNQIIGGNNGSQASYDIYLQLALGYLVNRDYDTATSDSTIVSTGEINNFIKLDHRKVVNTTLALLEDAVMRNKAKSINDTDDYKIMMFFIEPYRTDAGKKFFNIIAYGNGDYIGGNIQSELAIGIVGLDEDYKNMKLVYEAVEDVISDIVNCTYGSAGSNVNDKLKRYDDGRSFYINLNSQGSRDYDQLIREMETYPHYVIVVKEFALPTIFDGKYTTKEDAGSIFTSLSGDGSLSVPMCALNSGKVQRQVEDAGWSQKR